MRDETLGECFFKSKAFKTTEAFERHGKNILWMSYTIKVHFSWINGKCYLLDEERMRGCCCSVMHGRCCVHPGCPLLGCMSRFHLTCMTTNGLDAKMSR
jgi:hypothetical protein